MSTYQWDVFISHASEDKDAVARPLADKLTAAGIRVWLDANELTIGDSLRRKIDHGLAQSRYGVVILSPAFFSKEWPQNELSGLFALESARSKVILPIWHDVDQPFIARYSPLLADRLGISTASGLDKVRDAILRAIDAPTPPPLPPPSNRPLRTTSARTPTRTQAALTVVVIGIIIAAAWLIYSRRSADPFAPLETQTTQTAAAALFHNQAAAAGYTDAEVLESWTGDFLFEHWINPQIIHRLLLRESAANGRGDLAIGIWSDPKNADSIWRVYSGLTTPNVRPAASSLSLTMKARTIEPSTGPHRDNAAGLSIVASSLVLGAYTKSYPDATTWICTNFAPQGPPFIDQRTQSEAYERLTVQPDSPRCPPITFLAMRRNSTAVPAYRFRSLLNLGPKPAETIYVSVSRENDSHPLPVRVSLLWLKRSANSGTALVGNQQQRP